MLVTKRRKVYIYIYIYIQGTCISVFPIGNVFDQYGHLKPEDDNSNNHRLLKIPNFAA